MKIIAELTIIPLGVGLSLSNYIAECERILLNKGLTISLHAQGTNIEGEYNEVFAAIKDCIQAMHQMDAPRVLANIKVSSRTDKSVTMQEQIESVEEKI